jgi:uncharacterized protein YjiS (DUF1127 family)
MKTSTAKATAITPKTADPRAPVARRKDTRSVPTRAAAAPATPIPHELEAHFEPLEFVELPVWQRIAGSFAAFGKAIAEERRKRAAIRHLRALGDHMLADMGLHHSEIDSAVRNGHPRWGRRS